MVTDASLPLLRRVTITPPAPFSLALTCSALARFPRLVNRWDGETYHRLFLVDGAFVTAALRQTSPENAPAIECTFRGPAHVTDTVLDRLTGYVERMFGLMDDNAAFLQRAEHDPVIGPLTSALGGLRIFRKADVVEEVFVNILAQQISLPFAYQCKARLIAAYGPRLTLNGATQYAMVTPGILATLTPELVRPLLLSRQKATAMQAFGAAVVSGTLDLAALPKLTDAAVTTALTAIRGIGPWTAQWTLGRTLGRGHVVPVGDVGVQAMLGKAYGLARKMTPDEVRAWADDWGEHAMLAVIYLVVGTWRGLVS
jgi:DNA-3-methyladenine glycosylase II